jgi:glycosyltransferase involved in cell wall biosynthesis
VPVLPLLHRRPIVLTVHDPSLHLGEHSVSTEVFRRLMHAGTARFVLYNRTLKMEFCKKYRVSPARVDTAHLGTYDIFREWIAAPLEPQRTTVLFFGRLSSYKGLDVLYRAAPLVAHHVPGVTFVVAGYEPPAAPQLPNVGRIEEHLGYAANEQVARLFQRAGVVVCPYVEATQSGVALTAYAFGRPVVASAVGGLPEYVKHCATGLLVEPDDPDALAQALIRVLTDSTLFAELERGVAHVSRGELNWRQTATEIAQVYARAAST